MSGLFWVAQTEGSQTPPAVTGVLGAPPPHALTRELPARWAGEGLRDASQSRRTGRWESCHVGERPFIVGASSVLL